MLGSARRASRIAAWLRPGGARPWVLGHRGARHAAPENTLRAFELARTEGADGVELDVRLDADERVIVLHDRTLGRVSGETETRDVELLGARELDRVSLAGERVPLLAEVLAWARERGMRVNVELKRDVSRPLVLLRHVSRVVKESGVGPELVLYSSFHPGFVAALGALSPAFPRAWLIDLDGRVLRRAPAFRAIADGVNPHRGLVTSAAMWRWKRHGAPVATWTVNDEREARHVAELGVDTIISDKPGEILKALRAG
ncbi:MAG TPA: glycerophosphodiester phosphodiesterase [Polyangiaceae bacterium]|nr:glycerophosphodiester phosphodiesterase [Polyangiaceae bacterium]